jgi:thiazole synthase
MATDRQQRTVRLEKSTSEKESTALVPSEEDGLQESSPATVEAIPAGESPAPEAIVEEDEPADESGPDPSHAEVSVTQRAAPRSVAEVEADPDTLTIADVEFRSRLIVGTGKYPSNDVMVKALQASGAHMVTVAVRRVDLDRSQEEGVLHHLDADEYFLLANTAGCYTADEAIRYARLARSAGFNEWLKLEVIGDEGTLLPDTQATIEAARRLVDEGFKVMAYTNDDVVTALRLEDAGCVAVMPLASPIGSGLGVVNPYFIREIKRRLEVPVIVDAGVGTASDACVAMEQGMDGVLMNTAIAAADDPVAMAEAMRHGVRAGRLAFLAGRMRPREIAVPSSPTRGMLG